MLETMYVRCTHCGYDNSPEYRFCGMCGAALAHEPVATKPGLREAASAAPPAQQAPVEETIESERVHGPSFLGLAEDPKTEFHYLYEDEPPRRHTALIVTVVLVAAAGGLGYWQWQHNGFPFNRLTAASSPTTPGTPTPGTPTPEAPSAQSQEQQTNVAKPTGDTNNATPVPASQSTNEASTGIATGSPDVKAPGPAPSESPAAAASAPVPATQEPAPAKTGPTKTASVESTARMPRIRNRPPAPKRQEELPAQPAIPAAPDADLEQAGERYLYGNGLPQNCARAETALRTSADHGNSKALTVLGTMYATGHCVGRDLPTAYRWFARALHQEPQNTRIAEDLQVLWRQMTPQEKQLATASGQ